VWWASSTGTGEHVHINMSHMWATVRYRQIYTARCDLNLLTQEADIQVDPLKGRHACEQTFAERATKWLEYLGKHGVRQDSTSGETLTGQRHLTVQARSWTVGATVTTVSPCGSSAQTLLCLGWW
jgi:hypothetical protein